MKIYNDNDEFGAKLPLTISKILDLEEWAFALSYSKLNNISASVMRNVIFDSERCRIKFHCYRGLPLDRHEMHIYYGRLHAPNEDHLMLWKGEKHYCWHGSGLTHLYFLDGLSPTEALVQQINGTLPLVIDAFSKSELSERLLREPESNYPIVRESVIWQHYGGRLFDLFDLRNPGIWEKYTNFLKDFYRLKDEYTRSKGNTPFTFDPPLYRVC